MWPATTPPRRAGSASTRWKRLPVIPSVLESAQECRRRAGALAGNTSVSRSLRNALPPTNCPRQGLMRACIPGHGDRGVIVCGTPGRGGRRGAVRAPLMRLAEVLGSLHYLRNLCGEKGNQWRPRWSSCWRPRIRDPSGARASSPASIAATARSTGSTRLHRFGDRGDQPLHEGGRGAVARHRRRYGN